MSRSTRFRVDPRLATLLGENYRSSELALKELVDNAWDADATEVDISLPDPLHAAAPIIIRDNGSGMTPREVEEEYLKVADDRRSRRGDRTQQLKRPVKGRKGIGKFAGLVAASTMVLETRARGQLTRLRLRKEDLPRDRDLEAIDLPMDVQSCGEGEHGTTLTLTDLNQSLEFPSPEKLRELMVLEYVRSQDFRIEVNGEVLDIDDLPGTTFEHTAELPRSGAVRLRFGVLEKKNGVKQSGIVARVDNKMVGKPHCFGLEDDEEVPEKLTKKLFGEVCADGLKDHVTANWDAILENSAAFKELATWVRGHLKAALNEVHAREMNLAKARIQRQLEATLAKLPDHRRPVLRRMVQRLLERHYEDPERILTVASVCIEAMEEAHYFAVVEALKNTDKDDVKSLADALREFGLADLAMIHQQVTGRLAFLDHLDRLIANPNTLEAELHRAIESNLWLLGAEYEGLYSNQTLATVLAGATTKIPAAKRPDLLLADRMGEWYLLIEFKRPSHAIDRFDIAQAEEYRGHLKQKFDPIRIMMLGQARDASVDSSTLPRDIQVLSYASLISRARRQLDWLHRELAGGVNTAT